MKCLVKVPESQSRILKVAYLWLLFAEATAHYHPMRVQNKETFYKSQSLSTHSFQGLLTLKEVLNSKITILEYSETDIGEYLRHTVQGQESYDDGKSHRMVKLEGIASIEATQFIDKDLTVKFDRTEHTIDGKMFEETPLILKPQIQGVEIVCNPNGITGIGKTNNIYLMLV